MQTFLLGLVSIVLTAALTTFGTWWVNRSGAATTRETAEAERRRHARYLAIRVVCVLDDFADGCRDVVTDQWTMDASGEEMPTVSAPTLSMPTDVDWRTIDHLLMYRILQFPSRIQQADDAVRFVWRNIDSGPDHSDLYEARIMEYGRLVIETKDLCKAIRDEFDIPPRDSEAEAGIRATALSAMLRIETRRRRSVESSRETSGDQAKPQA